MLSSMLRLPGISVSSRRQRKRPTSIGSASQEASCRRPFDERSQLLPRIEYDEALQEQEEVDDEDGDEGNDDDDEDFNGGEERESDNEETAGHRMPLLPIFSAAHLDALPIYNLTHAIRLLIISKCETTLTWDQLRSPQVSQFLLRPIQLELRASHFSRATEYALMANCLQFNKEVALHPGNSGTSKTRAMVCELLAIKLLKEFSTPELIDALSYDFDPLQGHSHPINPVTPRGSPARAARISCLEVALRAQAKRFLAHPVVVQQLEAIWAGSIVFHATADSLHRSRKIVHQLPDGKHDTVEQHRSPMFLSAPNSVARRSVILYDPSDASLFKLSRLRVPRYRYFLSTCSYAVLLGLFLAVLTQKSLKITPLEVVFWFWSVGFILDEIVGFNEQGFSLYLASFWNTFDLGILLLLIGYLCLRFYGIIMPDARKAYIASRAYDVLAADAVLLFPRLFSVLDHYRYFSQLLIAFRMMASDLIAVFVLILISCSGFFVALTLSFGNDNVDSPASVAYALFQMLLGFTPAAWDRWDGYNAGGKMILTLFLFICHFLVVTILISVLTNSFMAIVQNANEEHQFVFAVNTISMVKSDALFSYIAPTNIIAWFITPLRFFVPFRRFVGINRTIIKITHFPVLFTIFLYEKMVLRSALIDTVETIEPRGRPAAPVRENGGLGLFSPQPPRRLREASVATWQKDRALEAVFRRPLRGSLRDTRKGHSSLQTSNTVNDWMQNMGNDGVLSPPQEHDRGVLDRLEGGRSFPSRSRFPRKRRDLTNLTRSAASDPEDFGGFTDIVSSPPPSPPYQTAPFQSPVVGDIQQTDADGDDEFVTSDNGDAETADDRRGTSIESPLRTAIRHDYFSTRSPRGALGPPPSSMLPTAQSQAEEPKTGWTKVLEDEERPGKIASRMVQKQRQRPHLRNVSSATIIYNPIPEATNTQLSPLSKKQKPYRASKSIGIRTPKTGAVTPAAKSLSTTPAGPMPSYRAPAGASRARPIMPFKNDAAFMSTPNLAGLVRADKRRIEPRRSSLTIGLGSDIGDNKAIGGGFVGAIPASFATQMAYATGGLRRQSGRTDDQEMFVRLVLTRMNKLEEGFKEVIHEMRESRMTGTNNSPTRSPERLTRPSRTGMKKPRRRDKDRQASDQENVRSGMQARGARAGERRQKRRSMSASRPTKAADKEQEWEEDDVLQSTRTGSV